uniref:Alpha/beta hydrolase fold-3 domain-containing protein n=1 Tax=Oryza punctata TaxID=4537 RepID=A0A0E0JE75_ORYPU
MSGSGDAAPHVVEDFYGVVKLLSDGSVVRGDESVLIPSVELPYQDGGVQWKDVVYDATHGLRVRVYTPPTAGGGDGGNKLPVLVYFHGGGYCVGALDQSICHGFCLRAAYELPAVVLSVQYRLAPEHRLPAAIDDGAAFISWLRGQAVLGAGADPWLAESADFARTFISGLSAGANLAHHVTVRVGSGQLVVNPVRVAGYVLIDPFLAGVERTAAEANPPADVSMLTVEMADQLWRMSLPVGATRDHPLANPFGPDSTSLETVALPAALVVASGGDVLYDRVVDYAARLKKMGKEVELAEFEGEQHGFSAFKPSSPATKEFTRVLKRFVHQGVPPC